MSANKLLVEHFYTCFQRLDWKGMQECYGEEVVFYDPVFENLNGEQVKSMWKMLCLQAKDLTIDFSEIISDDEYATCRWEARYTFTKTGRRVHNKIKAHFRFLDGKIIEHMDDFSIYRWSRQALGLPGLLFGWASAFKNKISAQARASLDRFMEKEKTGISFIE